MEYNKEDLNWLIKKTEDCSNRYMEAEEFIIFEVLLKNWWQRLFMKKKAIKFLEDRNEKYKF